MHDKENENDDKSARECEKGVIYRDTRCLREDSLSKITYCSDGSNDRDARVPSGTLILLLSLSLFTHFRNLCLCDAREPSERRRTTQQTD